MKYFTFLIILQLFYGFGMMILTYGLSGFTFQTMILQPYQSQATNPEDIASKIQSSTQKQINIPLIDLGALVFFSGNIFIDLAMNFVTALPGMFNLLVNAFCLLFNTPAFYATSIKLFIFVFLSIAYFVAIISFLLSLRGRGATIQ